MRRAKKATRKKATRRKATKRRKLTHVAGKAVWTKAEVSTLRKMYRNTPNAEIAKKLGKTVGSVAAKARSLGLKKAKRKAATKKKATRRKAARRPARRKKATKKKATRKKATKRRATKKKATRKKK